MDRRHKKLYVRGRTCVNCQTRIQKELRQTEGILYARVSYNNGTADVEYDADRISLDEIVNVIERMNYRVLSGAERKKKDIARAFYMLAIKLLRRVSRGVAVHSQWFCRMLYKDIVYYMTGV